ncbi:MAG: amidohydrolase family protein [Thermoplasmata archaeon]|nr:amidohydrolase family protein [Thermoplasmata archaeon]
MIVEGAIVDLDGPRSGYVRFRGAEVVEVGKLGTESAHGSARKVHGIVVPPPVNGHTHLGDAVATREPPPGPLAPLVRPPDGWKFRLLAAASTADKIAAMALALDRMRREGTAATIDFREEGTEGVRLLRQASRRSGIRVVALGRPLQRPVVPSELAEVLKEADGIGLSSALEEPPESRTTVARACRAAHKLFGLHASENVREDPGTYLDPRPDLLVHLSEATEEDLRAVATSGATVAVCPRSNALFGKRPDLALLAKLSVPTILGTDNAMFHAPSIWRELEFAYVAARLGGRPVPPGFLVKAACLEPWKLLGEPEVARIQPGGSVRPIVVRLPADDPEYQLVSRTTEHLIVRPGTGSPRRRPG